MHGDLNDQRPAAPTHHLLTLLVVRRGEFLAFVRGRVQGRADADDLLQQGFERAALKLNTLRDPDKVVPWFYRVLRRLIAEHHATWAQQQKRLDTLTAELAPSEPEEVASCGCALGLVDSLKPSYGDILTRVDLQDEPLQDTATALGLSVNNVTVRLHRARQALRAAIEKYCGGGSPVSLAACRDCACD